SVSLTIAGVVRAAGGRRCSVAAARKHAASREESDEQEAAEDYPAERKPARGRSRRRRHESSIRRVDGGRGTDGAARAIENRFYAGAVVAVLEAGVARVLYRGELFSRDPRLGAEVHGSAPVLFVDADHHEVGRR